jgi:hypothetical protein
MMQLGAVDESAEAGRKRKLLYWALSGISTFMTLLFVLMLMMVPGVFDSTKLWMLSVAAVSLTLSLALGVWKPQTSEAPITAGMSGPAIAIILALELAQCLLGIGYLLRRML